MRTILLTVVMVLTATTGMHAQSSELQGTSMYSYLGLGMPIDYRSSFGSSMGVTGVALSNRIGTSFANPALYSSAYFTTAGGGFGYRNLNATDQTGTSSNSQADALALQITFPIVREKVGFSFGMLPITENSYRSSNLIESVAGIDTLRYMSTLTGTGGLNRMEFGMGVALTDWLSVGYSPSLVFGTLRNHETIEFQVIGYQNLDRQRILSNIGFGNKFGVFSSFSKLLSTNDGLHIGATYSLPVDLNSDLLARDRQAINGTTQIEDTKFGRGENQLPAEFVLGVAYSTNRSWLGTLEWMHQNWGSYTDFNGSTPGYMKSRSKIGGGFQYIPDGRSDNTFFNRFLYRGGISYDTGHLQLSDTSISTLVFSAGLGIPSRSAGSSIDLSVDYGLRGTTSHDLVREQIITFRVSFNLSELMFLQRKID